MNGRAVVNKNGRGKEPGSSRRNRVVLSLKLRSTGDCKEIASQSAAFLEALSGFLARMPSQGRPIWPHLGFVTSILVNIPWEAKGIAQCLKALPIQRKPSLPIDCLAQLKFRLERFVRDIGHDFLDDSVKLTASFFRLEPVVECNTQSLSDCCLEGVVALGIERRHISEVANNTVIKPTFDVINGLLIKSRSMGEHLFPNLLVDVVRRKRCDVSITSAKGRPAKKLATIKPNSLAKVCAHEHAVCGHIGKTTILPVGANAKRIRICPKQPEHYIERASGHIGGSQQDMLERGWRKIDLFAQSPISFKVILVILQSQY